MNEELKNNLSSKREWTRVLFMVFFGVCLYIATLVMCVAVIVQFLFVIVTGRTNCKLRDFSAALASYIGDTWFYLGYNSESKPFPFDDWPSVEETEDSHLDQVNESDTVMPETLADSELSVGIEEPSADPEPSADKERLVSVVSGGHTDGEDRDVSSDEKKPDAASNIDTDEHMNEDARSTDTQLKTVPEPTDNEDSQERSDEVDAAAADRPDDKEAADNNTKKTSTNE